MKKSRIVAALLCASMGLSSVAVFAQGMPGGPGEPHQQEHGSNGGPHGSPDRGQHGAPNNAHDNGHAPAPMHAEGGGPGGPDGHAEWRKGDRLSHDYRDRQYVVDDWRGYGLRQPPRGYQWVGVGGDYLLVAAASGIIAQIVLAR
ncbi:integral membrane protein-like protein [Caballeronia terrestris]|jgi:Ni/Co efflux regulator RcnB|uniref:Integral membrane protein-like protein n=1 Tax=Caballeronia terrestris TaxID=1226301 RepID=A0A158EY29_9BURK|nr:RcnB family protein [Caballeronia terrestris]SAL12442.1 integral membrane protein-like protein [Caballeronia terrestris]